MQVIQVATHYFGDGNTYRSVQRLGKRLTRCSGSPTEANTLLLFTLSAPCSWIDIFSASNRAKPTDEVPHQTTAMQYFVNQSVVVGTMWAMTDRDEQDQAVPMHVPWQNARVWQLVSDHTFVYMYCKALELVASYCRSYESNRSGNASLNPGKNRRNLHSHGRDHMEVDDHPGPVPVRLYLTITKFPRAHAGGIGQNPT